MSEILYAAKHYASIACPKCGAFGDPCRTPKWKVTAPHKERRRRILAGRVPAIPSHAALRMEKK